MKNQYLIVLNNNHCLMFYSTNPIDAVSLKDNTIPDFIIFEEDGYVINTKSVSYVTTWKELNLYQKLSWYFFRKI